MDRACRCKVQADYNGRRIKPDTGYTGGAGGCAMIAAAYTQQGLGVVGDRDRPDAVPQKLTKRQCRMYGEDLGLAGSASRVCR